MIQRAAHHLRRVICVHPRHPPRRRSGDTRSHPSRKTPLKKRSMTRACISCVRRVHSAAYAIASVNVRWNTRLLTFCPTCKVRSAQARANAPTFNEHPKFAPNTICARRCHTDGDKGTTSLYNGKRIAKSSRSNHFQHVI